MMNLLNSTWVQAQKLNLPTELIVEAKESLREQSEDSSDFLDFGSELTAELMQVGLIAQPTQPTQPVQTPSVSQPIRESKDSFNQKLNLSSVPQKKGPLVSVTSLSPIEPSSEPQFKPVKSENSLSSELSIPSERRQVEISAPNTPHFLGADQNLILSELGVVQADISPDQVPFQKPKSAQSVLSGSEFIHTLNSIRNGTEGLIVDRSELSQDFNSQNEDSESTEPKADFGENLQKSIQGLNPSNLKENADFKVMGSQKPEITGHVIKNVLAKEKLSTESVIGITKGINAISSQGGGEMRVRLRPDHLGELNIHVSAQGNRVGLKIQASSEESKKILEESLGQLKERLETQQLALNQVEFTIAPLLEGLKDHHQNPTFIDSTQSQPQGQFFSGAGDFGNQRRGGDWRQSSQESTAEMTRMPSSERSYPGLGRANLSSAVTGRIDIRA